VPETAEEWLMQRMAAQETHNVVNLPSTPVGWSAGKWGEWYPDLLQPDGKLGIPARVQDHFLNAAWIALRLPISPEPRLHLKGSTPMPRKCTKGKPRSWRPSNDETWAGTVNITTIGRTHFMTLILSHKWKQMSASCKDFPASDK
jgi:hypothetical protein